jgi:hypothetical protein
MRSSHCVPLPRHPCRASFVAIEITSRPSKRPRLDSVSASTDASTSTSLSAIDRSLLPASEDSAADATVMKLSEKDDDSTISLHPSPDDTPVAGPSSSNGHAKKASASGTNGSTEPSFSRGQTHIAKVALPGTALYDDSSVDREEYVRLVIQSLRDIGYMCVVFLYRRISSDKLPIARRRRHWKPSLAT